MSCMESPPPTQLPTNNTISIPRLRGGIPSQLVILLCCHEAFQMLRQCWPKIGSRCSASPSCNTRHAAGHTCCSSFADLEKSACQRHSAQPPTQQRCQGLSLHGSLQHAWSALGRPVDPCVLPLPWFACDADPCMPLPKISCARSPRWFACGAVPRLREGAGAGCCCGGKAGDAVAIGRLEMLQG
jgi:hypothetical protein